MTLRYFDTPERGETGYEQAKQKLTDLVLGKMVDIKNTKIIDKRRRLVTDVYYNGKNLADYFLGYKN